MIIPPPPPPPPLNLPQLTHRILEARDYATVWKRLGPSRQQAILYTETLPTYYQFKALLAPSYAIEIYNDRIPSTLFWLSDRRGKTATAHFASYEGYGFEEGDGHLQRDHALQWAFDIGYTTLFGLTPGPYRSVMKNILVPTGWKVLATVPDMCYMAKYGRYTTGVISMLEKQEWDNYVRNKSTDK